MKSWRFLATIVAAMLLVAAGAGLGHGRGGEVLALQRIPVCDVEFTIDAAPTVEVPAGQSIEIPFTASISVSGISTAYLSISIGVPINFDASFSPTDQVIAVSDPGVTSTYNVVGSITAVISDSASAGQFWDFSPSSATLTCEGAGSSAALQDSDSAPGFRIVAQAPPATATATPASTPTPPPTNTPAPTATPVPTSIATATPSPTPSPSPSPAITATPVPSPTVGPTALPSPTVTATRRPTTVPSPSPTASSTAEPPTATRPAESPTATSQNTPTPTAPTFEPTVPPTEEGDDALVLEISDVRLPAETRDDDDRTLLRAGMGLLGIIALTAGTIGIWSGIRHHI